MTATETFLCGNSAPVRPKIRIFSIHCGNCVEIKTVRWNITVKKYSKFISYANIDFSAMELKFGNLPTEHAEPLPEL
jgi:hypothetical protein